MDIHQLRSFKTIVEKGNFQDAAKELNYSLSAISYQIQQLENEVKFPLFEKIGRRMMPTAQSLKLIPHIKKIEEEIEQIRQLNSKDRKVEGDLTISASDSLLTYILQPVLKEFIETAPGVKLKLKVRNCYEVQKEIIRNNVDLGIHYQVNGYDDQIKVTELSSFTVGVMASPVFSEQEKNFDRKDQTKSCSIINNDPNGVYQQYFDEYLKKKNIRTGQSIELWSIEAIKKSIMNNLGIACLPHFVVAEELKKGEITELNIKGFQRTITMISAHHCNKWISPAMELFLKILNRQMAYEPVQCSLN
ncbi:LysR family transcriptional regulator [Chryseobacterium sp. MEBOG06]|uniref:LysR family transcriptional regulator n=1 Tax=unclassified Chryseobacterium TaxID=2593645 RepID=UPI001F1A99A4|nr:MULTISPECIES: LysR family transcriptional regulator [unclassified Chryseobacterium]UKB86231.1 LysR family transcriptional regulator [Chryseobacterium sp. MEBOG06]